MDTCGRATTETDGRAGSDTVLVIYTNTQYMPMLLRQMRKYVLQPGEEAFTPMVRQYRWFHGTQTLVTRTLFPGYLFIQANEKLDFYLRVKQLMGQVPSHHWPCQYHAYERLYSMLRHSFTGWSAIERREND